MVTYVSTRVGFGSSSYFTFSGGVITMTAPAIVPSSYSMVEPNLSSNFTNRYWSYVATEDGAVRVDAALSMPGPNGHLYGNVELRVFKFEITSPTTTLNTAINLHVDGSSLAWPVLYYSNGPAFNTGSFAVEAGSTYIIHLRIVRTSGAHHVWGPVLRMSAVRPATSDSDWYQVPDRTVHVYGNDSGQGFDNDVVGVNDEENYYQSRAGNGQYGSEGFGGNFEWNRSFGGLDPITGIGAYLGVTHAWQHACSESRGVFPTVWANFGFTGLDSSLPGEYPYAPAHYGKVGSGGIDIGGGASGVGAWSLWDASTSGLGFAQYADSRMSMWMGAIYMSLGKEAWYAGRMVGWTEPQLIAWAGEDPNDVVGLIYEDEDYLPEVTRVRVVPDWNGSHVVADTWQPAPAQWWVAKSRYVPSAVWQSGSEPTDPAAAGIGWGPFIGNGTHPGGPYIQSPQWVLGDTSTGKWPAGYIAEMSMTHLGDYNASMKGAGLTAWEVPEEIWRAALDVEQAMADYEELYGEYEGTVDEYRYWAPIGLTFLVGIAEALAAYPVSPGVTQPAVEIGNSHAKGLHGLTVWPLVTFRPSRFKIVYAPELEIPLLEPTGGPLTLRQHFEPIAKDQ